jgi:hypothetical protein
MIERLQGALARGDIVVPHRHKIERPQFPKWTYYKDAQENLLKFHKNHITEIQEDDIKENEFYAKTIDQDINSFLEEHSFILNYEYIFFLEFVLEGEDIIIPIYGVDASLEEGRFIAAPLQAEYYLSFSLNLDLKLVFIKARNIRSAVRANKRTVKLKISLGNEDVFSEELL